MQFVTPILNRKKQEKNAKHIGFYFLKHNCSKLNKQPIVV